MMSTGLSVVRELPTKDPTDQPGLANHCSEADESNHAGEIGDDEGSVGREKEGGVVSSEMESLLTQASVAG
jgi:hypothetical protein